MQQPLTAIGDTIPRMGGPNQPNQRPPINAELTPQSRNELPIESKRVGRLDSPKGGTMTLDFLDSNRVFPVVSADPGKTNVFGISRLERTFRPGSTVIG